MKTILYDIDGQIWYELKAAKHQADRLTLLSQVDVLKRFANRIEAYFGPGVDNAK